MSVDSKVTKAHEAFLAIQDHGLEERAGWLDAAADALEDHRERLVEVGQKDTNLPAARLNNELTRTVFQLKLLADEVRRGEFLDATVDHHDPDWGMGPRPDIRRLNVPIGVVGVFGASNFPFAFSVAGGDTASAWAAGCPVVHKIHGGHVELGELTAQIIIEGLQKAGAPEGMFSAITGREAGIQMVEHPKVKAIGFTGSVPGGRALFDRAASRPEPIPFYGELGSINPVVITEQAWQARGGEIAEGFVGSMTMGIGQFCTKPGLVFVPTVVAEQVKDAVAESLQGVELPGKMLNDRIAEGFTESRRHVAEIAGVERISGNDSASADPPEPTVFHARAGELAPDAEVLHTEMFGPAAVVISYESSEELLGVLDHLPGQLTGTIHAESEENIDQLMAALAQRCGRLLKNGWPTGVTVSYAQHHGGPYPATTTLGTSVGTAAVSRFLRAVAYQDFAEADLPEALQDNNPLGLRRRVDGNWKN
ncbi:aldehyde dehydrogenase (NADP(+)) [Nesterenkonia salmonea]|uniref:Aldehyde dehydrogenase (NADP(+)) n=1 Tax=Nesterenkonia salmonea TaxID=1804987 RepID=A0A5R9BLV9_9MICC|nr:aldehyde dehydrogenase (NADP(+)) [Nesterenkonia salmonea]TLQ01072.1 aldehyde dehydrogenase (NADP(+)) [Nesterenkonia salmonea]